MQRSDIRESLLDDELILPEQFFARLAGAAPKRPEVKLWIAVLEGAWKMRDRAWFESSSEELGSFRWLIWQVLGLDADQMQPLAVRSLLAAKSTRCKRVQGGAGRQRIVAQNTPGITRHGVCS